MKELHARAQSAVTASPDEALALLRAVEHYPEWYPSSPKGSGVASASVLERATDGTATKVRAVLHVVSGPIVKDFNLTMAVTTPAPGTVALAREPHGPGDPERFAVTWTVTPGAGGGSTVALALDANLSIPRFLPVTGVGETIANGFVNAASARLLR
jgi:ribosome-associated toxin RatA of RatAB toxin-antitoxin module